MDKLTEIIKEVLEELAAMDVLRGELTPLRESSYPGVYRAQGSVLHDFYTACERIFLRIADLYGSARRHSDQDVRSAVVSDPVALKAPPEP